MMAIRLFAAAALLSGAAGLEVHVAGPGGEPVSGAVLSLVPLDGGPAEPVEVRAPEGRAVLEVPHRSLLTVRAPGYVAWSDEVDDSGRPLTVRLHPAASLAGRLEDETGKGVASAVLRLEGPGERPVALETDTRGRFHVEDIEPGLYRLEARAAGHVPLTRERLDLRPGATARPPLTMRRASFLEARVLGADGKPLREAAASVVTGGDEKGRLPEEEAVRLAGIEASSDAKGSLRLGPLPRGLPLRIAFRHPDHASASLRLVAEADAVRAEVRLHRGGTLRLVAVSGEDEPVAGATARLDATGAPDLDLAPAVEPSAEDGTLLASHLPAAVYSLRLRAEGMRPRTLRAVRVEEGETADLGRVELAAGRAVAGRVLAEGGDPVPEARLTGSFFEEGRKMEAEATAGEGGKFRLEGLPEGSVEVRAVADGYLEKTVEGVPAGTEDLEVVLTPSGSLAGRVLDAATGEPVRRFTVTPSPAGTPKKTETYRKEEVEDADGRFRVGDLSPGAWSASVTAEGHLPARSEEVEVRPGEEADAGTIRLERGKALVGTVLDAESGAPVPAAVISAGGWRARTTAATDEEGRFRVEGLSGPTSVRVEHPDFAPLRLPDVDPEADSPLTVRLERGGRVEGRVFGEDEEPVVGARVRSGVRSALTDAGGSYALEHLPPGETTLRKEDVPGTMRGYETAVVEVVAGGTVRHDFGRGARLFGAVTHAGGPAPNARLTLYQADLGDGDWSTATLRARSCVSAEDGSYALTGLPPGRYNLQVAWEGRTFGRHVAVGEEDLRLDVEVPDLEISGRVVDDEDRPLAGATVQATLPPSEGSAVMSTDVGGERVTFSTTPTSADVSDLDGRFRLLIEEKGSWSLSGSKAGYSLLPDQDLTFDLDRSVRDATVRMQRSAVLTVHVLDAATGAPLPAGNADFFQDQSSHSVGLDGSATAVFRDLAPGTALAAGTAAGRAPAWKQLDLRPGQEEELTFRLDAGGTLRVFLPSGVEATQGGLWKAGLRIRDAAGADLTQLLTFDLSNLPQPSEEPGGPVLWRHIPATDLVVRIGGGETGLPERVVPVGVPLGGEAVADLR